ncbi:GNAT family N-acetyltransferase [Streptomyces sp. LP11]|uniref:GNAT family N-acetyltransferase n=1 Tax=Streptomyces pyxinicus TaxID=2970331 RepID=A0ABT2B8G3_9ACTN|nr:GNAT family N-acetyltransferase [Streptomyces sp. LP11]MCS0604808.1 GNAT family N-acetyltransferase [Streptomyces sp. LP11]
MSSRALPSPSPGCATPELGFREKHRHTRFRPAWQRVARRDGRPGARAAWWGGPEDTEPLPINWLDVAEGEEDAGAVLLRTAPWRPGELALDLPAGRRADPARRAAAETRDAGARLAGYQPLVERFLYRWTPGDGLPARPGRLRFGPEPDDTAFLGLLRRVHPVTLDTHARRATDEGGAEQAAREELAVLRGMPSPRAWWQVARTRAGDPVGGHVPARDSTGSCVGSIGVLPEHRGHGYAYDLLAACTHFLTGLGAVAAATDRGNLPMAAHCAGAGCPVVRERLNYWAARTG